MSAAMVGSVRKLLSETWGVYDEYRARYPTGDAGLQLRWYLAEVTRLFGDYLHGEIRGQDKVTEQRLHGAVRSLVAWGTQAKRELKDGSERDVGRDKTGGQS